MKPMMQTDRDRLAKLLEKHRLTAGMYVRVHGDHLIMGRKEKFDPDSEAVDDDRVRLTRLSAARYGLSVKRHTGRWERTPFSGSMTEMVEAILTLMQHLVAPYS
jgi:hypothetical protein